LLQENSLNFIEASALDRSNVVYAFETIIRDMYRTILNRGEENSAYSHVPTAGSAGSGGRAQDSQTCCRYL
jgi:hypothetical protein